jgi:prepilin-type N-terminal cleavage/methylation domain-containing protein
MVNKRTKGNAGFSLMEMLVVIGIIVLLAGMIVALIGPVSDKKKVNRTRAEIARIATMIETYQAKKGFYPPGNAANPNDPTNTSLFYELTGARFDALQNRYETPLSNFVTATDLQNACGVGGILNSDRTGNVEDSAAVLRLLDAVKPDQTNSITVNGARVVVFVAPADGPDGRRINPIYYRIGSATNDSRNPATFDLWAVIKSGGGTKIIGNWKD